jgi:hypothetical protein
MLLLQLPRQAPANADVAEVVDNLAKDGNGGGVGVTVRHGRWVRSRWAAIAIRALLSRNAGELPACGMAIPGPPF